MCDSERGDLFFFLREAGAVVGHLTEEEIRILCRASRQSRVALDAWCVGSGRSLVFRCAAPSKFHLCSPRLLFMQHLLLHIPKAEMVEIVLPNLHPGSSRLEKTGTLICHDSTKELKVRWLRAGVFHQLTFIAGCSLLSFWFPHCSALSLPGQAILYKEQMEVITGHRRQRKEQNEGPKMEINIR